MNEERKGPQERDRSGAGGLALFVDPGLRGSGCAIFRDRRVWAASYVVNSVAAGRGLRASSTMARHIVGWVETITKQPLSEFRVVLVEFPRIYPGFKSDKDPNDLLDLAAVGSATVVYFRPEVVGHVFPAEWKGQVKKGAMNDRVEKALDAGELAAIVRAGSKDHNTLDAVGIGLNYYGRINMKVYA